MIRRVLSVPLLALALGAIAWGAVFALSREDPLTPATEGAQLKAGLANESLSLGVLAAITGDVAPVAQLQNDDAGTFGSVQVFGRAEGASARSSEGQLAASDGAISDMYGSALAADVDVITVGAPGVSGFGGAVYVYRFNDANGHWAQDAKLTPSDWAQIQDFWTSVSVSGDQLAVGAPFDSAAWQLAGVVYLFRHGASGWTHEEKLTASDAAAGDPFGWSVSASGAAVLVGAPEKGADFEKSGAAYLFRHDGSAWGQETQFIASDAHAADYFGWSVALSGDLDLVGAPFDDDAGTDAGVDHLFRRNPGEGSCAAEGKLVAADAGSVRRARQAGRPRRRDRRPRRTRARTGHDPASGQLTPSSANPLALVQRCLLLLTTRLSPTLRMLDRSNIVHN